MSTEGVSGKAEALNEIRFGERLAQRTARFYRRWQTGANVVSLLGVAAAAAGWAKLLPPVVAACGGVFGVLCWAAGFVVRPGDKAAQNEAEAKRYARLQTDQHANDAPTIRAAQLKARESDVAEIEPLRDVVWNDVMHETGNPDLAVPLSLRQRVMRWLS